MVMLLKLILNVAGLCCATKFIKFTAKTIKDDIAVNKNETNTDIETGDNEDDFPREFNAY